MRFTEFNKAHFIPLVENAQNLVSFHDKISHEKPFILVGDVFETFSATRHNPPPTGEKPLGLQEYVWDILETYCLLFICPGSWVSLFCF